MKIVFIGCVELSKTLLLNLISLNAQIVGVCTTKKSNFNSDHSNLADVCYDENIPVNYPDDINSIESERWIKDKNPDFIFCFGWSRLLKENILLIPKYDTIGFHPAELPKNRGRHPIVWALALGLKKTASTFFSITPGIDDGDIISQKNIKIKKSDDAMSLYLKISKESSKQIELFFPDLLKNNLKKIKQNKLDANNWRKRSLKDGKIDWRMSAKSIYNLVRSITHPYVGSHIDYFGQKIKIWKVEIVIDKRKNIEPGKVISVEQNNFVVKTGDNAIKVYDYDPKFKVFKGDYL